jgi:hypothetical protein
MNFKSYISNPSISPEGEIGLVSFEKDFIFSSLIEYTNTNNFIFAITDENINDIVELSISDTNFDDYTLSEDEKYLISGQITENTEIECFGEVFEIRDNILYKKITLKDSANEEWLDLFKRNNDVYAASKSSKFDLLIEDTKKYIRRKNASNSAGLMYKPCKFNMSFNGELIYSTILYDAENIFDTNSSKYFRLVVNEGKNLSLLIKDKDANNFKKIKTFSFPKRLTKGGIKLSIDESMNLSQLSFSFLKADI